MPPRLIVYQHVAARTDHLKGVEVNQFMLLPLCRARVGVRDYVCEITYARYTYARLRMRDVRLGDVRLGANAVTQFSYTSLRGTGACRGVQVLSSSAKKKQQQQQAQREGTGEYDGIIPDVPRV